MSGLRGPVKRHFEHCRNNPRVTIVEPMRRERDGRNFVACRAMFVDVRGPRRHVLQLCRWTLTSGKSPD